MKLGLLCFLSLLSLISLSCREWDSFSADDRQTLQRVLGHWEGWVPARKAAGTAPLIDYDQLYAGLGEEETRLLDRIRAIKPSENDIPKDIPFHRIENQIFIKNGKRETIGAQYLPENVWQAYEKMMRAMEKDLGKRLLVESGYRSPAYQLYTFLFYLPKHSFSIRQTREWVALPGHSEHGDPSRQAIDFINEEGINGEDRPEDFEALEEYRWLHAHAQEFGFELSYPRGTQGTTFEPWHWRFVHAILPH